MSQSGDIKLFIAGLIIIIALDMLVLGVILNGFYKTELSTLGRMSNDAFKPNIFAAGLTYILISLGFVLLILPRIPVGEDLGPRIAYSALFGLLLYGFYELTNYSMLKDWSLTILLVDIIWGIVLCSIVGVTLSYIRDYLFAT
jgi:uncharacterized membrane protein